jgi:hypothetical protein
MNELPIFCTLTPRALKTGREGGPISFELTGPPGTREFVAALLDA